MNSRSGSKYRPRTSSTANRNLDWYASFYLSFGDSESGCASYILCVLLSLLGRCHRLFTVDFGSLFNRASEFNLPSHSALPIPSFGYHVLGISSFLGLGKLESMLEPGSRPWHSAGCSVHGKIVLFAMTVLFPVTFVPLDQPLGQPCRRVGMIQSRRSGVLFYGIPLTAIVWCS